MAYFGGIFFANMGGGGGQNYFHKFWVRNWYKSACREAPKTVFSFMVVCDPDIFWSRSSAENLGWILYLGLEDFRKIAGKFPQQIYPANFSALFLQGFRPPPKNSPQNFTPRIVGIPLQLHIFGPKRSKFMPISACGMLFSSQAKW